LALLRTALIAVAALFLLKPVIRYSLSATEPTKVLVLQDVSESMSITDSVGGGSRLQAGMDLLRGEQNVLGRLKDAHEVSFFGFGAFTAEAEPTRELKADQRVTAIGEALKEATSRVGGDGQNLGGLAGVVLLSDGVNTAGEEPHRIAPFLGVPVYCVALGGKEREKGRFFDIGIASAPRDLEFIVNNKATVRVRLANYGLGGFSEDKRRIRLSLKRGDEKLAEEVVQFPSVNGRREVTVEYVPRKLGLHRLTLALPVLDGEAVTENNTRTFTVRVTDPRLRTLVLEGKPRSEYRFLRRTLESGPNVELTGVVKLRKDKFLLQGVDAGVDLSRGLPARGEDFKKFDVIILGDIGAGEFAAIQLDLLVAFVADGGGLMTTGGYHAYGAGGYAASALDKVLPLLMGGKADGHTERPFTPRLLPGGEAHPVLDGCAAFFREGSERAALDGANRTLGAKPGATLLLVHPSERAGDEALPVLAAQRYGAGRVLSLTADTTWKWKFQIEALGMDGPYYRFWRQAVRWLAGRKEEDLSGEDLLWAGPNKVEYAYDETVLVEAKVRRRDKQPHDGAAVEMEVHYPVPIQRRNDEGAVYLEKSATIRFNPVPLGLGRYQASLRPPVGGIYRAVVKASDAGGMLAQTEFEFAVGQATSEFDRVDVDEVALRALAAETGGEFHTLATAGRIPDELERRRRRVIEQKEIDPWSAPLYFMPLFLAFATAEWLLRKRSGLN
ncbi:MAG: glutamine amidotransferase, partial [Candidatus Brocadiia bacterium]|nr:glutamine amidotransferase [Candidatus Brocadiia bacterium]